MKILILSALLILTSSIARADGHQVEQVNFNQEIDQNNASAKDLTKDISAAIPAEAKADPVQDEKDKVTNFVDFEIQSVGAKADAVANEDQANPLAGSKQVIDRRYNSVEEPEVTLTKSK